MESMNEAIIYTVKNKHNQLENIEFMVGLDTFDELFEKLKNYIVSFTSPKISKKQYSFIILHSDYNHTYNNGLILKFMPRTAILVSIEQI